MLGRMVVNNDPSDIYYNITSLPDDKYVGFSEMKALADNNFSVAGMIEIALDSIEKNCGKGENADYQHFLFLPQCFSKESFSES